MKLLLIDDHALFREGVAALVEQRMPGVALHLAGDLNAARNVLAAHPDCRLALLDLGLPNSRGLDGIARLRELAPALPIVVLSADDRPETVLGAIDRGAAGPSRPSSTTMTRNGNGGSARTGPAGDVEGMRWWR